MIAELKTYTFEEYLQVRDPTDRRYELFNGELIAMPPASGFHALILAFLSQYLTEEIEKLHLDWRVMPGTIGIRTDERKSRIPDLTILTAEQCREIRSLPVAVIEFAPVLVIEIVSPGNADDDYRYKRSEYAVRGIPEYWIVDPIELKVSILTLVAGFYEVAEFRAEEILLSPSFGNLSLTPKKIFDR